MKQKLRSNILVIGLILGFICPNLASAQTEQGALSYLLDNNTEAQKSEVPKTAAERLESLNKRHDETFAAFSQMLNRLSTETNLLGSKELFTQIDKTDRDMKSLRTSCTSFMASLRASAKSIQSNKTFTDEQKKELLEAAEGLDKDCKIISDKTDVALTQLAKAYSTAGKWKTIHKTYRDLQGDAKAGEQVKIHVDEYLNSFTEEKKSEPEANTETKKENTTEPADGGNEVVE